MSLINEMLKDLEERGGTGRTTGVRAAPVTRARGTSRGPVVILAILVALLGGTVAWLLQPLPPVPASVSPVPGVAAQETPLPSRPEEETKATLPTPADDTRKLNSTGAPPAQVMEVAAATARTPAEPETSTRKTEAGEVRPEPGKPPASSVIVRRHEPTAAERAARAGRDGFAALRLGDWATAARLLGELVALEPANDEAREGLVVALANQGRIAESDSILLDGIAVGTAPARFAKLRARLQAARGELDAALDSLSVAVPAIASDPEFHALKAALAQQAGQHETASGIYRALTALDPANGTWLAGLGMALDALGDHTGAETAYRRAYEASTLEPALRAHVERRLAALKTDRDRT